MNLNFITIVSGLPRSGTSMMMQALDVGGLQILTDHIREKDEDNPKGYYEFEPAKRTKDDPSWVSKARGKVVKVIYRLIYGLPDEYQYRIIFMSREIDEVLASQKKMLQRSGRSGAKVGDDKLAELFTKQSSEFKSWIDSQRNFSMLLINYKDMINNPVSQCERINAFLEVDLDIDTFASVVDPTLYRNRA